MNDKAQRQNKQEALRSRSGNVNSDDPLVSFFYELMRDHLPPGKVEALLEQSAGYGDLEICYTNGYLAKYAQDIAARFRDYKDDAQ